jgi:hypothetical protein
VTSSVNSRPCRLRDTVSVSMLPSYLEARKNGGTDKPTTTFIDPVGEVIFSSPHNSVFLTLNIEAMLGRKRISDVLQDVGIFEAPSSSSSSSLKVDRWVVSITHHPQPSILDHLPRLPHYSSILCLTLLPHVVEPRHSTGPHNPFPA